MEKKEDKNNLDVVCEDSIFSVTEDIQYPIFDADQAKQGIVGDNKTIKDSRRENYKREPVMPKFHNDPSSFANNSTSSFKLNEFPEALIKIDEPLSLKGDDKPLLFKAVPNSKTQTSRLGPISELNKSRMARIPRQIGTFRGAKPTPLKTPLTPQNPLKDKIEHEDLSPRSKVMPGLAKKINSINNSGWFSKVVPKSTTSINRNPLSNFTFNNDEKNREETKIISTAQENRAKLQENTLKKETTKKNLQNTKITPNPILNNNHALNAKPSSNIKQVSSTRSLSTSKPVTVSQEKSDSSKQISTVPNKQAKNSTTKKSKNDTKSKHGLAGRKDVVYKTLLRSIKRYYSSEFEEKTEYQSLTKSKQEK